MRGSGGRRALRAPAEGGTPAAAAAAAVAVFDGPSGLFEAAAEEVARIVVDAVARRGQCAIALSGGSTPRALYARLAERTAARRTPRIPWRSVAVFWSDERAVPPDDPRSNFRMAHEALLSRVPVRARAIHRVYGEIGAAHAAVVYDATIRAALGAPAARNAAVPRATPRFDLVLLGVGPDGHTASLFPGGAFDPSDPRIAAPAVSPAVPRDRVTLTLHTINAARVVLFVVAGVEKAEIVARAVGTPRADLPASLVAPGRGRVVWLVDRAAAAQLSGTR